MGTSAIPAVIEALHAHALTALPGLAIVTIGYPVTEDPGDFLMIGVDDPDAERANAASSQQRWAHANHTTRDEVGEVRCTALAWNGDSSAVHALRDAFAITAAFEASLRADPTLGLANVWNVGFGVETTLNQWLDGAGAFARVDFSVEFKARI